MTYGIGDTSLVRAEQLEEKFGTGMIFLKLEGENPTGTHKDRLAIQHVDDAIIRGYDTISVGSCGNYGVAMSFVACRSGLDCKVFMPKKYSGEMVDTIRKYGAEIHRIEGSYEDSVIQSRKMAEKNGWYDANPGNKNTPTSLVAYVDIADEIQKTLNIPPETISVPVGNGTTLAGIHLGYRLLWRKQRSEKIPHMLGASSLGNNAIIETLLKGEKEILELQPESIVETKVNEALLNWRAYDGQEAVNAIYDTNGIAVGLTDEELLYYQKLLKNAENVDMLAVSAATLGALEQYLKEGKDNGGPHVLILTSGVKDVRNR